MSDKPKCFFHVGTEKTGSSAIQSAWAEHQVALRKQGYQYPDLAGKFRRARAGLPTTGNAATLLRFIRDGAIEDAIDTIRPYRGEHLILSHEAFANLARIDGDGMGRFTDGVRELGFEPVALVMFRPQAELIPSFYLQQVKANKTALDLQEYLVDETTPERLRSRYNWLSYARRLEAIFGAGLEVRWYPQVARGEGVTAAAFRWLGLQPLAASARVVNPSPGIEALAVLRGANASGRGGRQFADPFLQEAEKRGWLGSKVTLGEADARRIEAATRETNEELLARFCPDVSVEEALAPTRVVPATMDQALLGRLEQLAAEIAAQGRGAGRAARLSA